MKPLIGITTGSAKIEKRPYNKVTNYYDHSIVRAGGIPVLLPILEDLDIAAEMASRLDAILISGGNDDIDPIYYGEQACHSVSQISSERDFWEFALYQGFKKAQKPILGICRGCQVINVFEGGSLFQNLCDQIDGCKNHFTCDKHMCELYHNIKIEPDSKLYSIFKTDSLAINSFHNQAVKQIAPGFKVSALSDDGIIEAIEADSEEFIIGIQAHPEALTTDFPHFMNLFDTFINAARTKLMEF